MIEIRLRNVPLSDDLVRLARTRLSDLSHRAPRLGGVEMTVGRVPLRGRKLAYEIRMDCVVSGIPLVFRHRDRDPILAVREAIAMLGAHLVPGPRRALPRAARLAHAV